MVKIRRALISVSDKAGVVDFAAELHNLGVEILSTGGTAKALREAKIPVIEVSDYTGFPEMLDGRVKTLHPKIHGGLLALRDNPKHIESLKEHTIGLIDMVVVNLYPFEKTTQKPGVSIEEVIENKGCLSEKTLSELGVEVFKETSHYDAAIHRYLKAHILEKESPANGFPHCVSLNFVKAQDLRYGENPHQKAAFYRDGNETNGLAAMKQLAGKELSFNNILDLNSAVNIVREFSDPAAVFIKHNNPCGAAQNEDILKAYKQAWSCDRLSAFGGIVAINRDVDLALAKLIAKSGFLECVISPKFSLEALGMLKDKKNLRLLELPVVAAGVCLPAGR